MEGSLYKIVLTGGPCAGKTTALSRIEQDLTDLGFHVFVVSESATELIKGGARPFGNNSINMVDFQRLMLDYQISKERIYENASFLNGSDKNVIIYDRGALDNKAYINQNIFDKLLSELGISEIDLMDNYDMVVHLVTAADGAVDAYTLSNNTARTEGIDEAKKLDKKTLDAWMGHPNLKIIDNSTSFEDKMKRVLDEIHSLLGISDNLKVQRKYLISSLNSDFSFLNTDNSTLIEIEQYYLDLGHDDFEQRLRKRTIEGHSSYYFQTERKIGDKKSIVITDKKISEKDFERLLSTSKVKATIKKKRYAFNYNKVYMTLDIFNEGLCILEVNGENEVSLPNELLIEKEVTNDPKYNNSNLGLEILKLTK